MIRIKGWKNAACRRETLARKVGAAERAARGKDRQGRDGRPQLRRGVGIGRLRGNQLEGLERKSLQTRHQGQVGQALQEARIRDVKSQRNRFPFFRSTEILYTFCTEN